MSEYPGIEQFDKVQRIIFVAAHPDDLETQCGGTLLRLIERGVQVYSVNCTLGDIGSSDGSSARLQLALARQQETAAAAELLGLTQTFNLGQPDGELVADLALRAEIARLYRLTQADTLITFDPYWQGQMHPDHRAAGQAALDAYMPSKMPLYQPHQLAEPGADLGKIERVFIFNTDRASIYVDVSDVYARKMASCRVHRSQFPQGDDSLRWMQGRDKRLGEKIGVEYAEAYATTAVW